MFINSQIAYASCTGLPEYRSALPRCDVTRPMARRFLCAVWPCRLAGVVEVRNTNPTPVAETQPRHRRSRWKPPGYLCVADLVGTAPLSRASVYREIASGKLRSARSRGHIFVHKDDYSRWLADAEALHVAGAEGGAS